MTIESSSGPGRPVALVTGVGRTVGIGAGIAFTYWTAYDERMSWGIESFDRHFAVNARASWLLILKRLIETNRHLP